MYERRAWSGVPDGERRTDTGGKADGDRDRQRRTETETDGQTDGRMTTDPHPLGSRSGIIVDKWTGADGVFAGLSVGVALCCECLVLCWHGKVL